MNQQVKSVRKPRSLREVGKAAAPSLALNGLALSISTAMLMPAGVMAQTAATSSATLPTVRVQEKAIDPNPNAEVGVPYKAKTSADERHTRPLAETPQTIQVLTKKAIDESGYTDLKQILSAQPGITLGTGENGNAFGDRYIIRGQEARSDVFVDGLRDPGMTTRESFAVEQLEISKGPNSSFAGRGTAGGAVNAATKQATLDYNFAKGTAAIGSDSHKRFTVDTNYVFSDTMAMRLNALYGNEDVPGRSPSERDRKGVALSALFKPSQDLDVVVDYYGMRAKDKLPDIGSVLVGTAPYRIPAEQAGVRMPVYAQNSDGIASDVDTLTARIDYRLNADTRIVSRTRYGQTDNFYRVTGSAYGSVRPVGGGTPYNAVRLSNGHTGWQEVEYFAHQTNVLWNTTLGGMKHEFVAGAEYTDQKATHGNFSLNNSGFNCITGSGSTANAFCVTGPGGAPLADISSVATRNVVKNNKSRDWEVRTLAVSLMDTVDLNDKWTAFGGIRADHYKFSLDTFTPATGAKLVSDTDSDTLINGHLGLTYKINPQGMVYASVATATDINGGESDSSGVGYGGAVVDNGKLVGKPERSKLFEIGTKWNVLDDRLLFSAALFRTNKTGVLETEVGGTGYETIGANTGGNRVQGVEFGLVGAVTDKLTVQAGLALMKSKMTRSAANPTRVGNRLSNFADKSASVQMKYQVTDAFAIGGAGHYVSKICAGAADTAVAVDAATGLCNVPVPAHARYDLFASYAFNKSTELRFNVLNATDKQYYTAAYASGSFLYKGDGRAYRLTLSHDFF